MAASRPSRLTLGAVLAALLVILSAAPQSSETALLRLDKQQPVVVPSSVMAQMVAVQELATAWLVEAPASLVARLRDLRLSFEVLDTATTGKAYYLVFAPQAASIDALAALGSIRRLGDGIGLFWSGTEQVREIVPAEISLKRLSGPVRAPLSFLAPGRARAVERPLRAQAYAPFDPRIAEMVGQVSGARILDSIANLQSYQTRYASTSNCEASGTYIYDYFRQYSLQTDADYFTFSASNYTTSNIIATLSGQVSPDRVVIVCAHYDSYSNQAKTAAPGADDNASGTAAVMEIARILAGYRFDFTIKFIGFSAEEWGLYGSKRYAQAARQRGEDILGVVNMDMIGYADRLPEDLDLIVNDRSDWLGNKYVAAANMYAPLAILKSINASVTGSDHSPFWDQGYSALLGIEDIPLKNPHYHKPTDTADTLSLDFATAVTRASLAAVAELAQPVNPVAPPTGIQVKSQVVRSLFSSRKMVLLTWNPSPGNISGYHVYRTLTSRSGYQRANAALIRQPYFVDRLLRTDVTFYYVVTAVDAQGRESNYSVEVR